MKLRQSFGLLVLLTTGIWAQTKGTAPIVIDFEEFRAGGAPAGFTFARTGNGAPGNWQIVEDASAPRGPKVLAQTSADATSFRFPVCAYAAFEAKDVRVAVQFKLLSGRVDQAGGVVVRYKDAGNYYIARANALENNVRLYRVVEGRREQFAGANLRVTSGQWQTLALEAKGSHFRVFFNGKLLFEADDATFSHAGQVGLWTKADSVTYFDEFTVTPLAGN